MKTNQSPLVGVFFVFSSIFIPNNGDIKIYFNLRLNLFNEDWVNQLVVVIFVLIFNLYITIFNKKVTI